jgi:hypothetical protein
LDCALACSMAPLASRSTTTRNDRKPDFPMPCINVVAPIRPDESNPLLPVTLNLLAWQHVLAAELRKPRLLFSECRRTATLLNSHSCARGQTFVRLHLTSWIFCTSARCDQSPKLPHIGLWSHRAGLWSWLASLGASFLAQLNRGNSISACAHSTVGTYYPEPQPL